MRCCARRKPGWNGGESSSGFPRPKGCSSTTSRRGATDGSYGRSPAAPTGPSAVVRDGRIVGTVTSGNYGHCLGGAIGLGYVPCRGESAADVLASSYEIEIAGRRVKAEASLVPMYDPKATRVRM